MAANKFSGYSGTRWSGERARLGTARDVPDDANTTEDWMRAFFGGEPEPAELPKGGPTVELRRMRGKKIRVVTVAPRGWVRVLRAQYSGGDMAMPEYMLGNLHRHLLGSDLRAQFARSVDATTFTKLAHLSKRLAAVPMPAASGNFGAEDTGNWYALFLRVSADELRTFFAEVRLAAITEEL